MPKKYIIENGVMKLNPMYGKTTVSNPKQTLAIVSSMDDVMEATEVSRQKTGLPMQLTDTTAYSMSMMKEEEYNKKLNVKMEEKTEVGALEALTNIFRKHEVPMGLITKLMSLSQFRLNFIIDDSGSMINSAKVPIREAGEHLVSARIKRFGYPIHDDLTRWEEVEDRLHAMVDMLAYIPAEITMTFLNRSDRIEFKRDNVSPETFAANAHKIITKCFNRDPEGGTPLYSKLDEELALAEDKTMHYVFTDGSPSDARPSEFLRLIANRKQPEKNPITFISCTDDDATAWMQAIDEKASFTAEIDDFESEKKEVRKKQGAAFPFSKGFWLLCQLAAAINPCDLDAMDEPDPFTRGTLQDLMGRKLSQREYEHYFNQHPNAYKYSALKKEFLREDVAAYQIKNTAMYITQQKSRSAYLPNLFDYTFSLWKKETKEGGEGLAVKIQPAESKVEDLPPAYSPTGKKI